MDDDRFDVDELERDIDLGLSDAEIRVKRRLNQREVVYVFGKLAQMGRRPWDRAFAVTERLMNNGSVARTRRCLRTPEINFPDAPDIERQAANRVGVR